MLKRLELLVIALLLAGCASGALAAPSDVATPWKAQVSKAILEGRCDDAKNIALQANDLDVAEQALRICKPATKETTTPVTAPEPTKVAPINPIKKLTDAELKEQFYAAYQRQSGRIAETVIEYKRLADLGVAEAQHELGFWYLRGGTVQLNYAEALKYLKPAAEKGFARAQTKLGIIYENGLGVPRNISEAIKWYKLASTQGEELAIGNLSKINSPEIQNKSAIKISYSSENHDAILIDVPTTERIQRLYWPDLALKKRISGVSTSECVITKAGTPVLCKNILEIPTGYDFGSATSRVVTSWYRFSPAVAEGIPIESTKQHRIRWQAPKGLAEKLQGPVKEDTSICTDGSTQSLAGSNPYCTSHGGVKNIAFKDS
jgi:Sel1 repeat